MKYYLRKARQGEEQTVFAMVADRIKWMDREGIRQWNEVDYLEIYPAEYYLKNLGKLYVLSVEETERIVCAAVLFTQDKRWDADGPAFYIHNLVSVPDSHGAGRVFMELLEELAAGEGISYLRLDSAEDNKKLTAYYESLGFEPCGKCCVGKYHGVLRQKKVKRVVKG